MKETLQFIVSSIVDYPDDVQIDTEQTDDITNLIIKLNKEDVGKVIGKTGKIIRAIRNIMKIKAMKQGVRINITIAESENSGDIKTSP